VQSKHHAWNPHRGEPSSRKRQSHDPKGIGAEAPRSGAHDVLLILPFQALVGTFRNTIEVLCSVATQYATSIEAAQLRPVPSNSGEDVGGHKMHIFTANIPTFHSRYRRYVLITNEFHEFC
jgi:hypothetical protein